MNIVDRPLRWHRSRRDYKIEGALIHAMGEYIVVNGEAIPAWDFLDQSPDLVGEALSAHCLLVPSGDVIRCVSDDHRANHAGHSRFGFLEDLNWTFLGAEWLLPGTWTYDPDFLREMGQGNVGFTDAQYEAGGELYAKWMKDYDFARSRIVGHSVVSGDEIRGEGRGKKDPGVGLNQGRLTIAIDRAA